MRKRCDRTMGMVWPTALTIVVLILLIAPVAITEEVSGGDTGRGFDPTGKPRLQASLFGGIGSEKHTVGETTDNETVTISGGGAVGLDLEAGFYLSSSVVISGAFGFQKSSLSQKVEDADGSFSRTFVRSTLKISLPVAEVNKINIGGGIGYYIAGDLDLDLSKVNLPGAAHNIYSYKSSAGFHVLAEFERSIPSWSSPTANWSWGIGLRYDVVKYDLKSVTSDGVSIPLNSLSQDIKNDLMELDGSGVDIFGYLALYL